MPTLVKKSLQFFNCGDFCFGKKSGQEDWKQALKLQENFAALLPENVPVFLYHCRDDEEVPFTHLELYMQKLPQATACTIATGGHQLNNDLSLVAKDIKSL